MKQKAAEKSNDVDWATGHFEKNGGWSIHLWRKFSAVGVAGDGGSIAR